MFRLLGTMVIPVLVFPTLKVSPSVLLRAPIGATRTLPTTRRLYRLAITTIGRRVRTWVKTRSAYRLGRALLPG